MSQKIKNFIQTGLCKLASVLKIAVKPIGKIGKTVYEAIYPSCYVIGIRVIRLGHFIRRSFLKTFSPVGRLFKTIFEKMFVIPRQRRMAHKGEVKQNWATVREWVRGDEDDPLIQRILRAICMPFLFVYTRRHSIGSFIAKLFPLAAAAALVVVIYYWSHATFALSVIYGGKELGTISDEAVFDAAATMAEGRVSSFDESFSIDRSPKMSLTIAQDSSLMNETDLCDVLLNASGNEVTTMYGIYVDDEFEGAFASEKKAKAALQSILDNYASTYGGGNISNVSIDFVQDVKIVKGLYPAAAQTTMANVLSLLTDKAASEEWYTVKKGDTLESIAEAYSLTRKQLLQMNPSVGLFDVRAGDQLLVKKSGAYAQVSMTCTVKKNEAISYKTETVKDTQRYVGDNYVKIKGKNGVRQLTYEVSFVDGKEVSRKKTGAEVLREPITQVNAVGAMNLGHGSGVAGDGVVCGKFIWPLPSSYSVGETFGYQVGRFHNGIDIFGNYGAPIVAADGGTVVEAIGYGYNGGWGETILVDHGSYQTRYSHCSAVLVSAGDKVSQGQVLGRVGSTGYSTCNHLHFEVYYKGSRIDPYPLITS